MKLLHEPGEKGEGAGRIERALVKRVGRESASLWCREMRIAEDRGEVTIPVANERTLALFEQEMRAPLEEAFREVYGRTPRILFAFREHPEHLPLPPPPPAADAPVRSATADVPPAPRLNERYTFANFVVGPSNRLAHAAAVAVSERPATLYNPLFVHGPVGVGKTHLLQAICHAVRAANPYARIAYVPCETFVNEYIEAVRRRETESFRKRYRSIDLLVVDDVHFLGNKEGSQEEFFHTYNALHTTGKQIVLSSDSAPAGIPALEERLVSRFASGMVAPIEPPTYEERVAILRTKASERGWTLPDETLHLLAQRVQSSVRELEGIVVRVVATASLANRKPDPALAEEVLQHAAIPRSPAPTIEQIQQVVAEYYQIEPADLIRKRHRSASRARQVAAYLARELTRCSLKELGRAFGNKDHTTMLYAIRCVEERLPADARLRADVDYLARKLLRT